MSNIPEPAQYLLRIDDLCPSVDRQRLDRLLLLLHSYSIRPILAVVPDNQDPELENMPPDSEFWLKMRELESLGAAIALHGYHHQCISCGKSLIPLHKRTEFAGLPFEEQQQMMRAGLEILRSHGLHPELWVSPRHGFDKNTLTALREEGIRYLSDGLTRIPFLRGGVVWIPQQLWAPASRSKGLWTICLHPNFMTDAQMETLQDFLEKHAEQFTSFARVCIEFIPIELNTRERLFEMTAIWRLRLRHSLKRVSSIGRR
jgi:predicted deacetylase